MSPVVPPGALGKVQRTLVKIALTYPESHEDHPWDHVAIKVRGKMFLILGGTKEFLTVTCKLPESGREALLLPFTEPTGYGMGKHGWVSARFDEGEEAPVSILVEWIEESFRAVAPKTVVKQLDAEGEAPPVKEKAARKKKAAKKKPAAKKAAKKKPAAKKKVAKKKAVKKRATKKPAAKKKAAKKSTTRKKAR